MRIHIRKQNLSQYLFGLFLFFLPLGTRKVLLTDYSFYTGAFTEYGSLYLYLSDLLLLATVLAILLFQRSELISGLNKLKVESGNSLFSHPLGLAVLLSLWFFLSAGSQPAQLSVTLFRAAKMLEMALLLGVVWFMGQRGRHLSSSLFVLAFAGLFQSLIAIYQYFTQHSLFLSPLWHKLTGEALLAPELPGVAKLMVDGEKVVRGYGTFPHPNLLAGFLILTLFISTYLYPHHVSNRLSSQLRSASGLNLKLFSLRLSWMFLFLCQFVALILTFSRSAWLTFGLSGLFAWLLVTSRHFNVSRETLSRPWIRQTFVSRETISDLCKRWLEPLVAICLALIFALSNIHTIISRSVQDIHSITASHSELVPSNDAFADRIFFQNVSRETIHLHPILGSGPGTAIYQIGPYLQRHHILGTLSPWQYQPTHNIYLLSAAEIGLIGLFLYLLLIVQTLSQSYQKNVSRETSPDAKRLHSCLIATLVAFLLIGCLDHYFWTLQQGQLMFWTVIGFMLI